MNNFVPRLDELVHKRPKQANNVHEIMFNYTTLDIEVHFLMYIALQRSRSFGIR